MIAMQDPLKVVFQIAQEPAIGQPAPVSSHEKDMVDFVITTANKYGVVWTIEPQEDGLQLRHQGNRAGIVIQRRIDADLVSYRLEAGESGSNFANFADLLNRLSALPDIQERLRSPLGVYQDLRT